MVTKKAWTRWLRLGAFAPTVILLQACGDVGTTPDPPSSLSCSIPQTQVFVGAARDAIPALTNPEMAGVGETGTSLWQDSDRVVGFVLDDQAFAVPLNIFWWHEIVNLEYQGHVVAITHCPLTGSSLGFDRAAHQNLAFGVSGLLFQNNLIMYDRTQADESLWPQMLSGARCGPQDGTTLPAVPVIEMTWGGWKDFHPQTQVVTTNTGFNRTYDSLGNPYDVYQAEGNNQLLYPLARSLDRRRPPKERGLGLPSGTGGIVFPYGILEQQGNFAAIHESTASEDFVLLWDARREAAMAYRPVIDGQPLTFHVVNDRIEDVETGSHWRADGTAISGTHAGRSLEPVAEAFVAFWFAWPAFFPDIEIWSP